jgi:hypothetical protein
VITPGTLVNTDEYIIYNKLRDWGYEFVTQWGNMQEMKTVTAFVRFMSTPLRAFGHSYAPTLLASATSRRIAGKTAVLSGLFRVYSQRSQERKSLAAVPGQPPFHACWLGLGKK